LDVGKAAWTLLAVFFGYANFVLSGYFKDISADAATGYRTLPVAFGRSIAAKVSDFLAAVTSLCAMMALGEITLASLSLMVGGTAALLLGQIQLHRISNDAEAHRAITPVVHGYILVLSGIAVSHKPEWMLLLLVFYGGFVVTMGIRPAKHQI
jgi:4-hydroxybenzoate polyprenyltransferase